MYFFSALIAFGALAYSVNAASMWIVLGVVFLSAIGLVLLLLPRFTPRAPRWAEAFVRRRYRRRRAATATPAEGDAAVAADGDEDDERVRVAVGVSGVNGATAVGPRTRAR
ncbi:UDP-GlcNAc:undecaprenyl-phosphate GlcNAc-1-phosphate transferase OS=Streptomyces griseomycini OX=66895 GN=FHS37_000975 PE=4 SV=1 [Streptomyces griseomycini]